MADKSGLVGIERLEYILTVWERLGKREKRVLAIIASRILMGQTQYGYLTKGKKNSAKETFEEACDQAVYTADAMMGLMEDEENR